MKKLLILMMSLLFICSNAQELGKYIQDYPQYDYRGKTFIQTEQNSEGYVFRWDYNQYGRIYLETIALYNVSEYDYYDALKNFKRNNVSNKLIINETYKTTYVYYSPKLGKEMSETLVYIPEVNCLAIVMMVEDFK